MTSSDGNAIHNVAGFHMEGEKITNLATPTVSTDATNKAYVD